MKDKTQKEKIREKIEEILPKKRTVGDLSIGFNVCLEEVRESLPKIIEQIDLAIKETEERMVRECCTGCQNVIKLVNEKKKD